MSWMDEIEYEFRYRCPNGHLEVFKALTCDREAKSCSDCGALSEYDGFNPVQLGMIGKVSYEQNGRKAFRITDGNGMLQHISETKRNYMESGDIKPGYTSAYENALRTSGRDDLLQSKKHGDLVKERAASQKAKVKFAKARAERRGNP